MNVNYTAPLSNAVADMVTLTGSPFSSTYYQCKPSTSKADKYECVKQSGPSEKTADRINYHTLVNTMVVLDPKPMILHRPFVPTHDTKDAWSAKSSYYICEKQADSAKTVCHEGQFSAPEEDGRKYEVRVPSVIPKYHHQTFVQRFYWPHFEIKQDSV